MKTAIILFNEKDISDLYIESCTKYAQLRGYTLIHATNKFGYGSLTDEFVKKVATIIDTYILFIDKGISSIMLDVVKQNPPDKLLITMVTSDNYSLQSIKKNVSYKCQIPIDDMDGKSRKREIVFARKCYFMDAKKYTNESFAKIGSVVNRDHATVMHGIKDIETTIGLKDEYEYTMGYKIRPVIPFPKPFKAIENKAMLIGQQPIKIIPEQVKRESKYKDIIPANNQPYHGYRVHQL